jgi:hypothetical protein
VASEAHTIDGDTVVLVILHLADHGLELRARSIDAGGAKLEDHNVRG